MCLILKSTVFLFVKQSGSRVANISDGYLIFEQVNYVGCGSALNRVLIVDDARLKTGDDSFKLVGILERFTFEHRLIK